VRPRFSIALLSEDRSEPTWRGLKAILQKLLRRFEDDGFTPRVEIMPADPSVRPVLIANRWRSAQAKDEAEKRELWRYLARKVAEPGGFVVFHYDGDTPWSKRTESPARAQFDREIRTRVEQVLSGSRLSREEISRRMGRIIECVPFYSVEAWTYQATARAIALCREKYRGADVEKFEAWGADRTKLDEVWKPKDQSCLGGAHNEELGKYVAVWEVAQAGCSMIWFIWTLHACRELLDALALPEDAG
jgi:hypothetical protein